MGGAKTLGQEAVGEINGERAAQRLDRLKKCEMVSETDRLMKGSGWLWSNVIRQERVFYPKTTYNLTISIGWV